MEFQNPNEIDIDMLRSVIEVKSNLNTEHEQAFYLDLNNLFQKRELKGVMHSTT